MAFMKACVCEHHQTTTAASLWRLAHALRGRGRGAGYPAPPRTDPGVRRKRTGLLSKVGRDRPSGLGRPMQLRSVGARLR